jgi:recombination protein RecA
MADKKKVPIPTAGQTGDKKKALETALAQIEKNYGKGTIMRLATTYRSM